MGLGANCQAGSEASNRVSMSFYVYIYIYIYIYAVTLGGGYVQRAGLNQYERRAGHPCKL